MTRGARWIAVAAGVLCGCASSPPMRYYTLSEVAADQKLAMAAGQPPVRLDRITIPTELDRTQLVRRIDATRLQILENDRWAAPLDDMIHRVLSGDLASRLPTGNVADPNEPALGEPRQSLTVDVQEFYGDSSCAVTLRAAWVLKRPDAVSTRSSEETHLPAAANCLDPGALPAAMSVALARLSDRIAAVIAGTVGATARQSPADH